MTIQDFIDSGYRVSQHLDEKEVAAAIFDAQVHYGYKLVNGEQPRVFKPLDDAVMAVAYILLVRRNVVATRAGGKEKLTPMQSQTADVRQCDIDKADALLHALQETEFGVPGNPSELVDDIAHIYYRTEFLGL